MVGFSVIKYVGSIVKGRCVVGSCPVPLVGLGVSGTSVVGKRSKVGVVVGEKVGNNRVVGGSVETTGDMLGIGVSIIVGEGVGKGVLIIGGGVGKFSMMKGAGVGESVSTCKAGQNSGKARPTESKLIQP